MTFHPWVTIFRRIFILFLVGWVENRKQKGWKWKQSRSVESFFCKSGWVTVVMVPCGHQSCLFSFSSQVSFFTFIILVVIKASMIRLCNRNAALVKKTHTKAITHHNIAIISFVTCIGAANVKDNPALQINSLKIWKACRYAVTAFCTFFIQSLHT